MFAKLYLEIAEAPSDVTSRYNRQDADQKMASGQYPVRQCHHYVSGGLGLGLGPSFELNNSSSVGLSWFSVPWRALVPTSSRG